MLLHSGWKMIVHLVRNPTHLMMMSTRTDLYILIKYHLDPVLEKTQSPFVFCKRLPISLILLFLQRPPLLKQNILLLKKYILLVEQILIYHTTFLNKNRPLCVTKFRFTTDSVVC